jgi:WD40 repeat protein
MRHYRPQPVTSVSFSADSHTLAASHHDKTARSYRLIPMSEIVQR